MIRVIKDLEKFPRENVLNSLIEDLNKGSVPALIADRMYQIRIEDNRVWLRYSSVAEQYYTFKDSSQLRLLLSEAGIK